MVKKLIQIDLDGVLNDYEGNFNPNIIPNLRDGAKEFLKKLSIDYRLELFTVRNKIQVVLWLQENELLDYIADISDIKNNYAILFIDDRALYFNGDFNSTIEQIKLFKPHWK